MDVPALVNWIVGLVVTVMVPVWGRTAAAISRNGREVAELRGRVTAIEQFHGELSSRSATCTSASEASRRRRTRWPGR